MARLDDVGISVGEEPHPRRYIVLTVVGIALLMSSVDQTIVATALYSLQRDLGAPVNWGTWTITVYALGQIVALPLAGRMSDQYGRKRVFLAAVAIFTIASLCCGRAENIQELVALRALQALGGGAFLPSATGIVSDCFGRDRDRAIGMFTSIFPIGGMVGPVLGGLFVEYWSWRGIFLINVPLGLALLGLGLWLLPPGRPQVPGRTDFIGIGLLVAGLLGVMAGITVLGAEHASFVGAFVLLAVGLVILAGFGWHSVRTPDPFIPLRLLRKRAFAVLNLINLLSGTVTLGFSTMTPLYAVNRFGLSAMESGTLLSARAIGTIVVSGIATFALRRTGYRLPLRVGFALTAAGVILLALEPRVVGPGLWLAFAAALTGMGMGISIPANNTAGLDLEPESAAAIAGIRGMSRQIGGITGISVISAISAASGDPGMTQAYAYLAFGGILLATIPLISLVPEATERR
ncbi:MAG: MFS transporter [Actinomycetota bacterium]|nr:MFS transporter [Actinomycetota bacterium]